MAGREAAELAVLRAAAAPELGVGTVQYAEGWYNNREQKNDSKFRGLFASCATYIGHKQEPNLKLSARLLSCRSLQ